MKIRIIILLSSVLCHYTNVYSQSSPEQNKEYFQKLHLGIKGGLNFSSITDYDSELGFHAGIVGQYMFSPSFGLESGIYFSQLQASISQIGPQGEKGKIDYNPAYVQIPLLALYKFKISKDFVIYPALGGYIATGVSGDRCLSGYSGSGSLDYFDDNTNKFDAGVSGCINLQYQFVLLGVGYDYGLMKINKEKVNKVDDKYNGNLKLSVGFIF